MPKKDKIYTKLITAAIGEPVYDNIVSLSEATKVKKAQILRSMCEDFLPETTFDYEFFKGIGGNRIIRRNLSAVEIVEEIAISLGFEHTGGRTIIYNGQRVDINVGPGYGIIALFNIVQAFYELCQTQKS